MGNVLNSLSTERSTNHSFTKRSKNHLNRYDRNSDFDGDHEYVSVDAISIHDRGSSNRVGVQKHVIRQRPALGKLERPKTVAGDIQSLSPTTRGIAGRRMDSMYPALYPDNISLNDLSFIASHKQKPNTNLRFGIQPGVTMTRESQYQPTNNRLYCSCANSTSSSRSTEYVHDLDGVRTDISSTDNNIPLGRPPIPFRKIRRPSSFQGRQYSVLQRQLDFTAGFVPSSKHVHFNQPPRLSPSNIFTRNVFHDSCDEMNIFDNNSLLDRSTVLRIQTRTEKSPSLVHTKNTSNRSLTGDLSETESNNATYRCQRSNRYYSLSDNNHMRICESNILRAGSFHNDRDQIPVGKLLEGQFVKNHHHQPDISTARIADGNGECMRHKSLTKSLSCYALKFLNLHNESSRINSSKKETSWQNRDSRLLRRQLRPKTMVIQQNLLKEDINNNSDDRPTDRIIAGEREHGVFKRLSRVNQSFCIANQNQHFPDTIERNDIYLSSQVGPISRLCVNHATPIQLCDNYNCQLGSSLNQHASVSTGSIGNELSYQMIDRIGTGELLRCLATFVLTHLHTWYNYKFSLPPAWLRNLQTTNIVNWIRSIDRALIVQGWSDAAFLNNQHVIFLFMLVKGSFDVNIGSERELHSRMMSCLYLSYSYLGNEISYPLKPFLSAEINQLLVQKGLVSKECYFLSNVEHRLLNGTNQSIRSQVIDQVTKDDDMCMTVEMLKKQFGSAHFVLNCAGSAVSKPIYDFEAKTAHPLDIIDNVLRVNILGSFNVIRLIVPEMVKNKPDNDGQRGLIVNFSSICGRDGQSGMAVYAASKAAIDGMCLPLARELAPHGLRVVTFAQGYFDTPMLRAIPDKKFDILAPHIPFPVRFGRLDEMFHLLECVMQNTMINGTTIYQDAATRMAYKI